MQTPSAEGWTPNTPEDRVQSTQRTEARLENAKTIDESEDIIIEETPNTPHATTKYRQKHKQQEQNKTVRNLQRKLHTLKATTNGDNKGIMDKKECIGTTQ